jgi:hypothetical protein
MHSPTVVWHAARSKAYQGREQDRATSGFYPGLDQAPGATENAVHRTNVRAIGRHRVVGTGQLIAQPYIGTKLAEFGAEVVHVEKPGGDVFRFTAPQLLRGPRPHGGDEAEVTKNKLSMGLDFKKARGIELLMALWKISDVWMESSSNAIPIWHPVALGRS